ncbi:uncharacterized protein DC041_0006001 [Schistosoma bovis]|uniref:TFIIS N-terminal domain-containing protein n=1 Tax=Schistosoma bovis TaxID=6184 RepID=A0A430PY89_SCHBO|nr:uncharacterized protein DC041_0006001 [Schistosoma bovis]
MSASVVAALVKFGETLGDKSVDTSSKLRVLSTLNEVKLTLSELSESGVGRAVRKLKNEPGELGKTASTLILKWKNLLSEHIKQESINISVPKDSEKCDVNETSKSLRQTSSRGKSASVISEKTINSTKSPENNLGRNVQHLDDDVVPNAQNIRYFTQLQLLVVFQTVLLLTIRAHILSKKRKSTDIVDSIDSSSGMSFMDSLNVNANTRTHRKKKCNLISASSDDSQQGVDRKLDITPLNIPLRPSEAFSAEIISSLSEPVSRPDVVHRPPNFQLNETVEDDFDNGDLKFKSKKVLWVPKQNRSSLPPNNHSNSYDNFPGFFDPPSLIDLCVDVLAPIRWIDDDLWRKYINRDFHHLSNIRRRPDETWCDFYNRLSKEETKNIHE